MKKKAAVLAIIMVFALVFAGCGFRSSVSTNFNYTSENNESVGTYSLKFNKKSGEESHALKMSEDGKVLVRINAMVSSGEISIKILTDEDKIIYESIGKVVSENESLNLEEGIYKVVLDYDSVDRGSLKIEFKSDSEFDYYRCEKDDSVNES